MVTIGKLLVILKNEAIDNPPVSGDLTLLSVLVLAFADDEDDEGVFGQLDKSSNWYSPGGTLPVLYLTQINVTVFIIIIIIIIVIFVIIIVMTKIITSRPKAGSLPQG